MVLNAQQQAGGCMVPQQVMYTHATSLVWRHMLKGMQAMQIQHVAGCPGISASLGEAFQWDADSALSCEKFTQRFEWRVSWLTDDKTP